MGRGPDISRYEPDPDDDQNDGVPRPVPDNMKDLQAACHSNLGMYNSEQGMVPIIRLDDAKYRNAMEWYLISMERLHGSSINTNMNILRDFMGNVFVVMVFTFANGKMMDVIINANENLEFFKKLADTGVLALGHSNGGVDVIMIQLPQPRKAEDALRMIEEGLGTGHQWQKEMR